MRETRSRGSQNTLLDPGHFSVLSATWAASCPLYLAAPTYVCCPPRTEPCPCCPLGTQQVHTHTCRCPWSLISGQRPQGGKSRHALPPSIPPPACTFGHITSGHLGAPAWSRMLPAGSSWGTQAGLTEGCEQWGAESWEVLWPGLSLCVQPCLSHVTSPALQHWSRAAGFHKQGLLGPGHTWL